MQKADDAELVQATLAGDKNAYGQLYDRYAPLGRAVCYDATRNVNDAQDLAQDVFLRAYTRLEQLRQPERFGAWIVGIARMRCSEWLRQSAREHRRKESMLETGPAPTRSNDEELARLGDLVADLPETQRLALHTFYLQGKSVETARQVVGLSRSGFYKALKQGLVRLRNSFMQESEGAQR